ncbi:unnamed protein product [Rotaria sordida]|uniref:Uncharacterized protein n=1 Tax=Rotaria sordida TaxID=392033 RepID=A0A819WV57_9BILA|nr:unnamed protein product [Rotaria sordida]
MNVGIVAERDLQVFGFSHLTFREYFVAQSLVRDNSSIENVMNRILAYTIHSNFREPLLFALSWISWKWKNDDYDKFCNLLVSPSQYYAIPFGTLLFFDAFDDLLRLPSNTTIFKALNSILDHPSDALITTYFIPNLFKLHKDILKEWMQVDLRDEQRLLKFCYCLHTATIDVHDKSLDLKSILPVIYEQLWSLYNAKASLTYTIDQTLRRIVSLLKNFSDDVLHNRLSSSVLPQEFSICSLHPLIVSVIIAVCGGTYLKKEQDTKKIDILPDIISRKWSVISLIIDYVTYKDELQKLIKRYETILENALPSDTSIDIVDTFIALLCLQGLSQPLVYQKYSKYQALPKALDRLRYIWFHLPISFDHESHSNNKTRKSLTLSEIELIMNKFFSQLNQSDEQCIAFSLACAASRKKIYPNLELNLIKCNVFSTKNIDPYLECQPEFGHSDIKRKLDKMTQNIHPLQIFQHEQCFLLTFVQQSLQPLYHFMIVNSINNSDSFPHVAILLSHCLMVLENANIFDVNYYLAIFMLLPSLKEYMFENYATILFEQGKLIRWTNEARDEFFKVMQDCTFIHQQNDWQILINVESQRINEAKNKMQSYEKDLYLFAASICLARLLRKQYNSCVYLTNENDDVHFAIINIADPILRMIALIIILDMKNPFIFHEDQRNQLILKMMNLFESLLPHLSLSMLSLLFVQCYKFCQTFPSKLQHIIHVIGQKLNETSVEQQTEEQKAAFIALRELNDADLAKYLDIFAQQNKNLSDLLNFNSTIFYKYFVKKNSFVPTNTILLSSMYLTELAFDAQILKMYTNNDIKIEISPQKKLQQLWNDSIEYPKMMTFELASWITNYLEQITNKIDLDDIIKYVSQCLEV